MNVLGTTLRSNGYRLNPLETLLNLDSFWAPFESTARESSEWVDAPSLDLHETKDNYVVHLEIPGVDRKEIKISIDDGVLTVAGERRLEKPAEGTEVHRRERFQGRFERRLTLPRPIAQTQVSAAYVNGVLTITLPKAPEAKPREIEISGS